MNKVKNQQSWNTKRKLQPNTIFQMARRLKLDTKQFGLNNFEEEEFWKGPLPNFIVASYEKRFGRERLYRIMAVPEN